MMSPSIALRDPIFRAYVLIVVATLALGGLALGFLGWGLKKEIGAMWQTYRSWLVMAPLALAVVFLGRVPTIVGVMLLALLAFKEFARASALDLDRWMTGAVYAGILAVGVTAILSPPPEHRFPLAVLVLPLALILIVPILRNRARGELQPMALAIIGFIYVGWMFGHLDYLVNSLHAYGYICYIVFATEVCDVAAFTFGRLLGRHPLRSEISPKKTWEGAVGAVAVAMVLPWLLRFSFPFFGPWQLVLTGLIVGIGGQLGDLSISVIKRDLGTKDMATTIPGHGGILDRIDSLIFVAPLFMHMAGCYEGLR